MVAIYGRMFGFSGCAKRGKGAVNPVHTAALHNDNVRMSECDISKKLILLFTRRYGNIVQRTQKK